MESSRAINRISMELHSNVSETVPASIIRVDHPRMINFNSPIIYHQNKFMGLFSYPE
jgi:hypothetical protein